MKQIIKANIINKGTLIFELPQEASDSEIFEYVLQNAGDIEWKTITESDIAYEVIDDFIKEDTDINDPDGYDEYRISKGIDF